MWSLPAASLENKVAVADESTSSLAVRHKQMTQWPSSSGSYETPRPSGPQGYNAVLDGAGGTVAFAMIANVKDGSAAKLRNRLWGRRARCGGVALRVHFGLLCVVASRQCLRRV